MRRYLKWLPLTILCCVIFLSIGFSSFSASLTLGDIEASVRPVKDIRVTNFYTYHTSNNAESLWDEYSVDVLASNIVLPEIDSEITYKFEVTNIGSDVMMINSIEGLSDNLTYEFDNYTLKNKICDDTKCRSGVKKEYILTIKYKDGATVSSDSSLIKLNLEFTKYKYKVSFDANGGTGSMDDLLLEYDEMMALPSSDFSRENYRFDGWNTLPDGSGDSYNNEQVVQNINKNDENEVTLYAQWAESGEGFYYPGYCIFNGQGNDVEGECAEGQHVDYVNTGIKLFSEENYQRSFVLSFTIKEVNDDLFSNNERATIFNALKEVNNTTEGKYPGILLRVEGSKWFLQASRGKEPDYSAKILFDKEDLLNKELKIIRYNDGESIKVYYVIGNNGPFLLKDITDFIGPFDTPLTFGASIEDGEPIRYSIANLKDISFEFVDDDRTLYDLAGVGANHQTDSFLTVFSQEGTCNFNGPGSNITGDDCSIYSDSDHINTEINLFSSDNASKDFEIYFELNNFQLASQPESQSTIISSYLERTGIGYGVMLRRDSGNLSMVIRNGNGGDKKFNVTLSNPLFVRIVRKDGYLCYSFNNSSLKYAVDMNNLYAPFNNPVIFGASIDKEGNIFRNINGSISNMYIKMGKMDDSVICNPYM